MIPDLLIQNLQNMGPGDSDTQSWLKTVVLNEKQEFGPRS